MTIMKDFRLSIKYGLLNAPVLAFKNHFLIAILTVDGDPYSWLV